MGSEVRVEGVETLNYLDHLREKERVTEQADAITFESEVIFNETINYVFISINKERLL